MYRESFKTKLIPYITIGAVVLLGSLIAIALKLNFLFYLLISFLPASIYLLSLIHKSRSKIIFISLFWGLIASQVLDSMAHISKTYVVESMFSFKLIATPVECYIWGVLFCILVLAGYEYFFDSTSTKKLSANHKYAIIILTTGFALFIATYILMPIKLNISYFYLIYTAIVLAIDFVILSKAKKIFTIALTYSVLFFPFYVIHEITALKQGYWTFHYENLVGGVPIFGFIVPIEELLFFIITPILVIGCYELFADNQKAMK